MKKKQKIWLILSGVIIFTLIILGITFNIIVSNIIESKVRGYLKEHKPIKGYEISFDKIHFNILNQSVNLIDLKITPDSTLIAKLVKSGYSSSYFDGSLKKLAITGIKFKKLLKNKELHVKKIKFKKPEINVYTIKGKKKKSTKEKEEKNKKILVMLEDSVKINGINGIQIGLIELQRGKFDILEHKTKKLIIENDEIELLIKNITLKKSIYNNDYLYTNFENASFTIEDNTIKTGNKLYEIGFKKFYVNFKDEFIDISKFRYAPLYSKKRFSKHIKWQQERFDIKIKHIRISGIDFKRLIISNVLHIKDINIDKGDVKIFRDKNVPFNHSKRPLLPHQALKRMNFNVGIDTVRFSKFYFEYEEIPKNSKHKDPLHIHLSRIHGTITNINSIKNELNNKSVMKANIVAYLMNKPRIDINMEFPLTAKNDVFYYSIYSSQPFKLKILNKAIYPAAGMKFEAGVVDKLKLHATAYPTFAHGHFEMLYHDLKMTSVDRTGIKNKKVLSWGINRLISSSNPKRKGKEPRKTIMFFERDMEKGIGNFIWKTIYSGMKGTIIPLFHKQSEKRFNRFIKNKEYNKEKK